MKKALYTIMAIVALFVGTATVRADEEKVDIKAEFEAEQMACLDSLVKAWMAEKPEKELTTLLANLVRANSRYRMAAGVDNSIVASVLRAMDPGKTLKEKVSLAISEYYRLKGINLDTRDNFNRGSFKVKQ